MFKNNTMADLSIEFFKFKILYFYTIIMACILLRFYSVDVCLQPIVNVIKTLSVYRNV